MAKKKKVNYEDYTPSHKQEEWEQYQKRLDKSITELESHLGLKDGTIWGAVSGTDAEVIIKVYANIEPVLNEILRASLLTIGGKFKTQFEAQDRLTDFIDALGVRGRTGKANLARDMGLIADFDFKFVDDITTLRNKYAHDIRNISLSVRDLCKTMGQNGERIAKDVLIVPESAEGDYNNTFRIVMYFNVASFISRAIKVIKPPPPPKGILGAWPELGDLPEPTA